MAFETVVHAWDGQGVVGVAPPFAADLAAEGIDEHLGNLPFVVGAAAGGAETTLHVRWAAAGLTVTRERSKADVALRGPASDLVVVVLGRAAPEAVEVFGDPPADNSWRELLHF